MSNGSKAVYLYVPFTRGSVSAKGYEGWIRITDFTFSVKAPLVTLGDWTEWMDVGDDLDVERLRVQ